VIYEPQSSSNVAKQLPLFLRSLGWAWVFCRCNTRYSALPHIRLPLLRADRDGNIDGTAGFLPEIRHGWLIFTISRALPLRSTNKVGSHDQSWVIFRERAGTGATPSPTGSISERRKPNRQLSPCGYPPGPTTVGVRERGVRVPTRRFHWGYGGTGGAQPRKTRSGPILLIPRDFSAH